MNIRVGTYLILLWSLIACIAHAAPDLNNLSINIDGIDYAVELEKSSFADRITVNLDASVEESTSQIELYQGTAPEVPGSWIAASYQAPTLPGRPAPLPAPPRRRPASRRPAPAAPRRAHCTQGQRHPRRCRGV